jgi:hypothetical protein
MGGRGRSSECGDWCRISHWIANSAGAMDQYISRTHDSTSDGSPYFE